MSELLELINRNSSAIQASVSVLMLVATLAYVWINSRMHAEMVATRRQMASPEIGLRLVRVQSGYYDLVICNSSNNAAFDLRFREYPSAQETGLAAGQEIGLLKSGISYMAPWQEYATFLLNYPGAISPPGNKAKRLTFSYTYRDTIGRLYERTIHFELEAYFNHSRLGPGTDIHEHLSELTKAVRTVAEVLGK